MEKNPEKDIHSEEIEQPLPVEDPVEEILAEELDVEVSEEKIEQDKIAELEDLVKRQAADFDNFRKRQQEEKIRIKDTSQEGVVLDFLPIFDNIERAFQSAKSPDASLESIITGFEGIMGLFTDFLGRYGIEKVDSIGMSFDPKIHEALFTQEGDYAQKEVIQEVEKAYIRKEKVIRTAKVAVGVPKENK